MRTGAAGVVDLAPVVEAPPLVLLGEHLHPAARAAQEAGQQVAAALRSEPLVPRLLRTLPRRLVDDRRMRPDLDDVAAVRLTDIDAIADDVAKAAVVPARVTGRRPDALRLEPAADPQQPLAIAAALERLTDERRRSGVEHEAPVRA